MSREADVAQRIHDARLTGVDRRIADVVLDGYPQSALLTAGRIATAAAVSPASVSRFSIKLGYQGFWELQGALKVEMRARLNSPKTRLAVDSDGARRKPSTADLWARVVDLDVENLRRTQQLIDPAELDRFVMRLRAGGGKVYVAGSKKANIVCQYFATQLNQVRMGVTSIQLDDELPDQLLDVAAKDILVIFEPRRATKMLVRLAEYASAAGATVAVFSDDHPARTLVGTADFVFRSAIDSETIFDSYVGLVALCHAVMASLVVHQPRRVRDRTDRLETINQGFGIWNDERDPPTATPR